MEWYIKCLREYVTFEGRARRKEYWMFVLMNFIFSIAIATVGVLLNVVILADIYNLAVLLPTLAVGSRRLHDTGRSAWWMLIGLVPLVGAIVLLIFFAQEGEKGDNRFGPNPKGFEPEDSIDQGNTL